MRIGIDNVLISRMEKVGAGFPQRYLTPSELKEYQSRSEVRRPSYLAGRFAAKEAYVKASGDKIDFRRIEIIDGADGAPVLHVDGQVVGQVSITHDFIATALVLLK